MADEYQVEYEYSAGNTISIKTNDLTGETKRLFMSIFARPDGKIYVDDPAKPQNIFAGTAIISGNDLDILYGVQRGSIIYSGGYPRIKKLYWDGDSTETDIEVAMTKFKYADMGAGWWHLTFEFTEKTD